MIQCDQANRLFLKMLGHQTLIVESKTYHISIAFQSGWKSAEKGLQFAKDQIEKHKEEINYDNPPRDYIDAFLIKMKEEEDNPDTPFTGQHTNVLSVKICKKVNNFLLVVLQLF